MSSQRVIMLNSLCSFFGSDNGGKTICLALILIIIGAVLLSLGALPRQHNLNGFHTTKGVVTPGSRWFYVSTSDDSYYEVVVHYSFLNDHSCRYVKPGFSSKRAAQAYIRQYGTEGQKRMVYYKPPNYFKCYLEDDLESNYIDGISMLVIGLCICLCPILLFALAYFKRRNRQDQQYRQSDDEVLNPITSDDLECHSAVTQRGQSKYESDHVSVSNPLIARPLEDYFDDEL